MKFVDYVKKVKETAIYLELGSGRNICYPILNIVGESGEVFSAIHQPFSNTENIISELGDVLWYVTMAGVELNIPLLQIARKRYYVSDFHEYQYSVMSHILLLRDPKDLSTALMLNATQLAKCTKKVLRSSKNIFEDGIQKGLLDHLNKIFHILCLITLSLPANFDDIATFNIEKLAKRRIRSILKER